MRSLSFGSSELYALLQIEIVNCVRTLTRAQRSSCWDGDHDLGTMALHFDDCDGDGVGKDAASVATEKGTTFADAGFFWIATN